MATRRQTWAIFCGTGLDVRHLGLSVDKASLLIDAMKSGENIISELQDLGAIGTPKVKKNWEPVWKAAVIAGLKAGESCKPRPMTVIPHSNSLVPLEDGVCGFAWISVKGNTSFGRWAKKHAEFKTDPGGYMKTYYWVSNFNQSYERKRAFAQAAVAVLKEHGVDAWSGSRLD